MVATPSASAVPLSVLDAATPAGNSVSAEKPAAAGDSPLVGDSVSAERPSTNSAPVAEVPAVPIEKLKETLVEHLQTNYGMLAITLGKTVDWYEADGMIQCSVQTPFEAQLLQKEKKLLAQKAAIFYKKELPIQINLLEEKPKKEAALPAQITMICRQLKGAVDEVRSADSELMEEEE